MTRPAPGPAPVPVQPPQSRGFLSDARAFLYLQRVEGIAARAGLPVPLVRDVLGGAQWPGPDTVMRLSIGARMRPGEVVEALLPVYVGKGGDRRWREAELKQQERSRARGVRE